MRERYEEEFERLAKKEIRKIQQLISEGSFEKAEKLIRNSLFLSSEQKKTLLDDLRAAKELKINEQQLQHLILQNEELKKLHFANKETKEMLVRLESKLNYMKKKVDDGLEARSTDAKWNYLSISIGLLGIAISLAQSLPVDASSVKQKASYLFDLLVEVLAQILEKLSQI